MGDSTKNWLLSHTRHGSSGHEDSATRRSSRENTRQGYEVTAKASKDSNTSDADRANSPKQEEDGTGSAQVEAIGERITRSRRRINTQELPRPMMMLTTAMLAMLTAQHPHPLPHHQHPHGALRWCGPSVERRPIGIPMLLRTTAGPKQSFARTSGRRMKLAFLTLKATGPSCRSCRYLEGQV
eukprot:g2706.t1